MCQISFHDLHGQTVFELLLLCKLNLDAFLDFGCLFPYLHSHESYGPIEKNILGTQ